MNKINTSGRRQSIIFAEALEPRVLHSAAPVEADVPTENESESAPALTRESIEHIIDEAKDRWIESGIDEEQREALDLVDVRISDLEDGILGSANHNVITIDVDASGEGWFIDQTAAEDEEFTLDASGVLRGKVEGVDLLSVVTHEIGHVLGLMDEYAKNSEASIMHGLFDTDERRQISLDQARGAEALSLEGEHFASLVSVGIGVDSDTLLYTEGNSSMPVSHALNVSLANPVLPSSGVTKLVVEITGGYVNGEDELSFYGTLPATLTTGGFDAATGKITFETTGVGIPTEQEYQEVLREVHYNNASGDPDNNNRTVTYTVFGDAGSVNAGFEDGVTEAYGTWGHHNESIIPGWSTTDWHNNQANGRIEIQASGLLNKPGGGKFQAYEGGQYAELNSDESATLWQAIDTSSHNGPGSFVTINLNHAQRSKTSEQIEVWIGANPPLDKTSKNQVEDLAAQGFIPV
ncbi:MAG: matrixin family metalloprotease, partial [Verrucomicrobiota bacterium]